MSRLVGVGERERGRERKRERRRGAKRERGPNVGSVRWVSVRWVDPRFTSDNP